MKYTYDINGNILSLQRNDANVNTMHYFTYDYELVRNCLAAVGGTGIPFSPYGYDPVGNLTNDHGCGMTVFWNSAGRVTGVDLPEGKTGISYSPAGLRQMKEVVLNGIEHKTTFYLHDASGHVMATYGLENDTLRVEDLYIYGSSRLGAYRLDDVLTFSPNDSVFSRPVGKRRYELTDHLGNVTVTLSDRKSVAAYSANYISYRAVSLSYTDYYPFGFPIAERSSQGNGYRYGFNGQEKDDEIYGEGASYTAEFWQYDSRLGRRWNVDPVLKPHASPYAAFANNPIWFTDVLGADTSFADNQARTDFMTAFNKVNNTVNELESKLQGYRDQLNAGNLKEGKERRLNRKIDATQASLADWNKLKTDFDNIISSQVVFHYTSDVSGLVSNSTFQEHGAITGGDIHGSGVDMTGDVYISIRPGYDDYVIHENRHGNQVLQRTNKRPVLEVERDAYLYQKVYNPNRIQQIIEDAKKIEHPDPNLAPPNYGLDNAIKRIYRDKIENENR